MKKVKSKVKFSIPGTILLLCLIAVIVLPFYIMLVAMIGMLMVGILSALYISLTSYQSAREQSTQALDISMRAYGLYLEEIKTSPSEEQKTDILNAEGVLDEILAKGSIDTEGEQLQR